MAEVLWGRFSLKAARGQYPARARDCLRRDEVKERHAERRHIMDAEKIGKGIGYLRRRYGFTQRYLAELLCISDKAVSKCM